MPYFYTEAEVDVDIDEFLTTCNKREIEELIDALEEDGYLTGYKRPSTVGGSLIEDEFQDIINKLKDSYLQMEVEDVETLKNIAKKY